MHAFEDLKMHRVHVTHREGNDASKIVIQKCGFVFEGAAREAVRYFDTFKNVISYGILANEYLAMKKKGIYSVQ
jgi:ribosomal-protein-alanine N-acetyltransferase